MTDTKTVSPEMKEKVNELLLAVDAGDQAKADEILMELTNIRESILFQELGKLTREFHDALNSFRHDERLSGMAQADIPDAKERLNYVIQKTDEAAHRTITALEEVIPICDTVGKNSSHLSQDWEKFVKREMEVQQFRELSSRLREFFDKTPQHVDSIRKSLNDVLLAQDFQDLTGQMIKRVIRLVDEVEKSLVNLLKLGSQSAELQKRSLVLQSKLDGPPIPGHEAPNTVKGQDEVDDLLSSLGF